MTTTLLWLRCCPLPTSFSVKVNRSNVMEISAIETLSDRAVEQLMMTISNFLRAIAALAPHSSTDGSGDKAAARSQCFLRSSRYTRRLREFTTRDDYSISPFLTHRSPSKITYLFAFTRPVRHLAQVHSAATSLHKRPSTSCHLLSAACATPSIFNPTAPPPHLRRPRPARPFHIKPAARCTRHLRDIKS